MTKSDPPVRWASRVHPNKLRRLYELDAQGILDEELLDNVGYALYSRCQSILHVSSAMLGNVHCPRCDTIIKRQSMDPVSVLHCTTCGWETTWGAYYNTYRTQELGAGGALDMFQAFVARWEHVRTARDKMLLIDQLIHRWHWETQRQRPKFGLGRPTGVNLIEGNRKQVLAFLDTLTYHPAGKLAGLASPLSLILYTRTNTLIRTTFSTRTLRASAFPRVVGRWLATQASAALLSVTSVSHSLLSDELPPAEGIRELMSSSTATLKMPTLTNLRKTRSSALSSQFSSLGWMLMPRLLSLTLITNNGNWTMPSGTIYTKSL